MINIKNDSKIAGWTKHCFQRGHIEINLQTLPRVFTHGAKCNIPITPTMTVATPGNREGML